MYLRLDIQQNAQLPLAFQTVASLEDHVVLRDNNLFVIYKTHAIKFVFFCNFLNQILNIVFLVKLYVCLLCSAPNSTFSSLRDL